MKDFPRLTLVLIFALFARSPASGAPIPVHTELRSATSAPVASRFSRVQAALGGQPPLVNAGDPLTLKAGTVAKLRGRALQPTAPAKPVQARWSVVSGPGQVSFTDASAPATEAAFSAPGEYVLQLSADDGVQTASDTVAVSVRAEVRASSSFIVVGYPTPPGVYAGPAQRIVFPAVAQLSATAGDILGTPVTTNWSELSGPGTVTFGDITKLQTTATFSAPGQYLLGLHAMDIYGSNLGTVQIHVIDPTVQTSLTMESDQGDYIGQGQSYAYDQTTGDFGINYSAGVAFVSYSDASNWWDLHFAAPGGAPLTVGTYNGALDYPGQGAGNPGLDVSGDGRGSNSVTGTFTIKKVIYGSANSIVSFWATFEQHSGGVTPALRGEIKFNAGDTTDVSVNQAPGVYAGPATRMLLSDTLTLAGFAGDDGLPNGTLTTTWSVQSGPGHVIFADPTQLQTTVAFAAGGRYVLQLTASDGVLSGTSTISVEVVDPSINTSLTINFPPSSSGGAGATVHYTLLDGDFGISSVYADNDVTIAFHTPNLEQSWELEFAAPNKAQLAVGSYLNSGDFPTQASSQPGLSLGGDGIGYSGDGGSFNVYQIAYGPNSTILSFDATFSVPDGSGGPLTGEVKYNAAAPSGPVNQAPAVFAGTNADVTLPQTLALAGTATDDGLPNGTLTTTWSMVSGPGTVTFGDPSALQTTASFSAAGTYLLQLLASDGEFAADSQLTVIVVDPTRPTSLTFIDEHGVTHSYTPFNGTFTVTENYDNGVSIGFVAPGYTDYWNLDFAGPNSTPLRVGSYLLAGNYPSQGYGQAGLEFSGEGYYYGASSGSFNVYEVTYGPSSTILSFHATFVIPTSGGSAAHGEVEYNAATAGNHNVPPTVSAGSNVSLNLPQALSLSGSASDDGLPNGTLTTTWSMVSGPDTVTFGNAAALQTTATFDTPGLYVLQLLADDGQFQAESQITVNAIDPQAAYSLIMTSDPGDPAGLGQTYNYSFSNASFQADPDGGAVRITVPFSYFNGSYQQYDAWNLYFAAPSGNPLSVNSYPASSHPSFEANTEYDYVDFTLDTSSFDVYELTYDSYGQVQNFRATFVQTAPNGSALRGEIRYNATTSGPNAPPAVSAGANAVVSLPQTLRLGGTVSDDGLPGGVLSTSWSVVSGPGAVTFADVSAAETTATFSMPGTYVLQLAASDGQFNSTSETQVIASFPLVPGSLTMRSDPGDYLGYGYSYSYSNANGAFTAMKNGEGGVSVSYVSNYDSYFDWFLSFAAPNGAPLKPGLYAGATLYLGSSGSAPGLSVFQEWGYIPLYASGDFTVKEIEYGEGNAIVSFWATFDEYADGSSAGLHGEVRYNASSFPSGAPAGAYKGVLLDARSVPAGTIRLTEATNGLLSGQVTLQGKSYSFAGAINLSTGTWEGPLGAVAKGLYLTLAETSAGAIEATIYTPSGNFDSALAFMQAPNSVGFPPALAGSYSLGMTEADSGGVTVAAAWAKMTVSAAGRVSIVGKCPDGTAFSTAGAASPTGAILVDATVTRNRSALAGALTLGSTSESDVAGTLQWTRQDRVRSGHTVTVNVVGGPLAVQGSRFTELGTVQTPFADAADEVSVVLSDFNHGAQQASQLFIQSRDFYSGSPGYSFHSTRQGLIRGTFADSETGAAVPFDGILLPKQQIGIGRFSLGGAYGPVQVAVGSVP